MFSTFTLAETNITPVGLSAKQKSMATVRVICPSKRLCRFAVFIRWHSTCGCGPHYFNGGSKTSRQKTSRCKHKWQSWQEKMQAKFPSEETFRPELGKQTKRAICFWFFGGFNPQTIYEDLFPFLCVLDLGPCAVAWLYFVC